VSVVYCGAVEARTFDQLVKLSEEELRKEFPDGAVEGKKGWRPRVGTDGEEEGLTLAQLLEVQKSLVEKPRLLHRDSTHGYTNQPGMAMRGEPEAVSAEEQKKITAEGHFGFAQREKARRAEGLARDDAKRVAARAKSVLVASARRGVDTAAVLAELDAALRRAEDAWASSGPAIMAGESLGS